MQPDKIADTFHARFPCWALLISRIGLKPHDPGLYEIPREFGLM